MAQVDEQGSGRSWDRKALQSKSENRPCLDDIIRWLIGEVEAMAFTHSYGKLQAEIIFESGKIVAANMDDRKHKKWK